MNQAPTQKRLRSPSLTRNDIYTNLDEGFDSKLKGTDYELLNLGSSFIKGVDSGIPVEAFHIVFARETIATVNLDSFIGNAVDHLAAVVLSDRCLSCVGESFVF